MLSVYVFLCYCEWVLRVRPQCTSDVNKTVFWNSECFSSVTMVQYCYSVNACALVGSVTGSRDLGARSNMKALAHGRFCCMTPSAWSFTLCEATSMPCFIFLFSIVFYYNVQLMQ